MKVASDASVILAMLGTVAISTGSGAFKWIREYVYAMTAVSPQDGRLNFSHHAWVDAETMSIFLAHTEQTFAGDFCLMLLEGQGSIVPGNCVCPQRSNLSHSLLIARTKPHGAYLGICEGKMPQKLLP